MAIQQLKPIAIDILTAIKIVLARAIHMFFILQLSVIEYKNSASQAGRLNYFPILTIENGSTTLHRATAIQRE